MLFKEILHDRSLPSMVGSKLTLKSTKELSTVADNKIIRSQVKVVFQKEDGSEFVLLIKYSIIREKHFSNRFEFEQYIIEGNYLDDDDGYVAEVHRRGQNPNSRYLLIDTVLYNMNTVLLKQKVDFTENKVVNNSSIF